MRLPISILGVAVVAATASPCAAGAGTLDAVRAAKLQGAVGELKISESRCPAGVQPGSSDCGKLALTSSFESAAKPRTRATAGRAGLPLGRRIPGRGRAECSAESPTAVVTGPDGSTQILSGASRLEPRRFAATQIAVGSGRRGVRFAWLEPLTPSVACTYFDDPATKLALRPSAETADSVVAVTIRRRVVRRARFSVVISGSREWSEQEPDGTQVIGRASWRLRLDYRH
jgi:hypothetical protein